MRAKMPRAGRSLLLIMAAAMLLSLVALTGCSLGGSSSELVSVADNTGFYHVKIPATWVSRTDPGIISLYAAEALPETDVLEDPAVLIFLSEQPTQEPLDEMLPVLVDQRATSREWAEGASFGEPFDIVIGGRDGVAMHVEATDAAGIDFQADFYLMRTAGREVLVMAVAPADMWDTFAEQLDDLRTEWYWHIPEGAAADTSATVEATAAD